MIEWQVPASQETPEETPESGFHAVWQQANFNLPVTYGVDEKTENGTRSYQAWCQVLEEPRLESEVYEACDEADPDYSSSQTFGYTVAFREQETARAARVRAMMRADQASLTDMQAIARRLHESGIQAYYAYQREEEMRKQQLADDAAALKQARLWLRGMALLIEGGNEDEIKVLRYLFSGKERRL